MTDGGSDYTHSVTASLQDIDEELDAHIHGTQYWAALQTPSVNLESTAGGTPADVEARYLGYRQRLSSASVNRTISMPAEIPDGPMGTQLTPSVDGDIPFYDLETGELSLRGQPVVRAPKGSNGFLPKPSRTIPNQTPSDWQGLLDRASAALGMKTRQRPSETAIKQLFERLLGRVEEQNVRKNHRVPGAGPQKPKRAGDVFHGLPKDDEGSNSNEDNNDVGSSKYTSSPKKSKQERLQALASKYKKDVIYAGQLDALPAELEGLRAQLQEQTKTVLVSLLLKCAQLLPTPELVQAPTELPLLLKQAMKSPPQLIQLQNSLLFAHEKLCVLYNSVPDAPEVESYSVFCQKLLQNFIFITEKQISYLQSLIADYRELVRFRGRVSDLAGHELKLTRGPQIAIYDSMKQNGLICEKLQLRLSSNGSQASDTLLAAEELLLRAQQCNLGRDPTGSSEVSQVADTLVQGKGRFDAQSLRGAVAEAPRLLIRLTDEEALEGFKVLVFVLSYAQRLLCVDTVQRLVPRLAELHMGVSTSRALIQNVKKQLGLPPAASANRVAEAVQALSARALDQADGADVLARVKQMLKVDDDDEVEEKLKEVLNKAIQGGEEVPEDESESR